MISAHTNTPGLAPGEVVVNKAELRIVEKLAALGRAYIDLGHAERARNTADDAVRSAGMRVEAARQALEKEGAPV